MVHLGFVMTNKYDEITLMTSFSTNTDLSSVIRRTLQTSILDLNKKQYR